MARKFGLPTIAALEVGGSCVVNAVASEVKRKVALYGGRNNKRFIVRKAANDCCGSPAAIVERLPVTDTELPGVG